MSWFKLLLRSLFGRRSIENELDLEMRFHRDQAIADKVAAGMTLQEASRLAAIEFGGTELTLEECRDVHRISWLENPIRDTRFALRSLRKSPGFTVVAVLTLALGIGANAAIFSVIDSVILRPLPFTSPDQLVRISSIKDGVPIGMPSPLDLLDFNRNNHTFQQIACYDTWRKNVSLNPGSGEPEQMVVGLVPGAYFQILDIQPVMGRLFTDDENTPGKNYVAAISANLWKGRFDQDKAILDREIRINDESYSIVAVMPDSIPAWIEGAALIQVWTPFATPDDIYSESSRAGRGDNNIARLKPGVRLEQAQQDLDQIAAALAQDHPVDRGVGVVVRPLADTRVGTLGPPLLMLMAAAGLILLIACSNLANLLMVRNSGRRREFSIRVSLGAGRGRLVSQLLAEALVLFLLGSAAGVILASWVVSFLEQFHPTNLQQLAHIPIEPRALLFALLLSILTGIIFGLAPALSSTRLDPIDALKEGGRSTSDGPQGQRLRGGLVVAQIALSLVLVASASLLARSIERLEQQELGIRQDHLLKGHIYIPPARYPDAGAVTRFADEFGARVRSLPGVIDASVTTIYPPGGRWTQPFTVDGHVVTRFEDLQFARFGVADAHLVRTLGIPLILGRDFCESDTANSSPVALISNEFKRRFFPEEDPIGKRVHIGPPENLVKSNPGDSNWDSSDVAIIGVIGDFRNRGMALPSEPQIICLYSQHPVVNYGFKDMVIRTTGHAHLIAPAVTARLHDLDADMPFAEVETLDELIAKQSGSQKFTTILLALFAATGLALAVVGIYGVVSSFVSQRAYELAVRVALGATPGGLLWLVLRGGLKMAVAGTALGLVGVWAARRMLAQLLFGISALDAATLGGVAAFLLAVAATASFVPAVRATKVDPAQALRLD